MSNLGPRPCIYSNYGQRMAKYSSLSEEIQLLFEITIALNGPQNLMWCWCNRNQTSIKGFSTQLHALFKGGSHNSPLWSI